MRKDPNAASLPKAGIETLDEKRARQASEAAAKEAAILQREADEAAAGHRHAGKRLSRRVELAQEES
jgi:hypothetical protein